MEGTLKISKGGINLGLDDLLKWLKSEVGSGIMFLNPADAKRFARKILAGMLGLLFDWDDTLTTAGKKNRSWLLLQEALRSMGNAAAVTGADEVEGLRQHYRKIEDARGPLLSEEMHKWHEENLRIFIRSGLRMSAIQAQIQQDAELYSEAAVLLRELLDQGAAVCIISAGIAEIIRLILKKYGIDPEHYVNLRVFAIELVFDEEGLLVDYDPSTIVTADDKSRLAKRFMVERGIEDRNVIAIGDGLTDAEMLRDFGSQATMVLFCPAHKIDGLTEASFKKMAGRVHAVVKIDFGIIAEVIKGVID